eukprot:c4416_g1_i1 orf=112-387(-)
MSGSGYLLQTVSSYNTFLRCIIQLTRVIFSDSLCPTGTVTVHGTFALNAMLQPTGTWLSSHHDGFNNTRNSYSPPTIRRKLPANDCYQFKT